VADTHQGPRVGALPGPRARDIVARDKESVSPSYTRPYPLAVDHARGVWVWDTDDNRFLDMTAGIAVCSTGHSHPRVVEAIRRQAEKFIHMAGTDFYYEVEVALAEALCRIAPGASRKRVFFANSGTEAVECAIKLARHATGRPGIIAFYGAFHGRTMGSLSLTASKSVQRGTFSPLLPMVSHVPYGNCHQCVYRLKHPECGLACVEAIERTLLTQHTPPSEIGAIFVEPIQGEGGYVVPPPDWLPAIRALCDKHGFLMVADEIQSGMGRTGRMWAVDHAGVVPDMILTAKGIASGMPLGACIARHDLMDWPPGSHGSTFGGNPISCAAGLATLELLEGGLIENAATVGRTLRAALDETAKGSPAVGHVSGLGLMLGVQIVSPETGRPDGTRRDRIVSDCFEHGLLVLGCGPAGVRFCPALMVTGDEALKAVEIFAQALSRNAT
jgi:4-aminobutyrate aminotransferase